MGLVRGQGLEIITPIRGRKLGLELFQQLDYIMFRNNNPDKGTEINSDKLFNFSIASFRNNNPDKGTEILCQTNLTQIQVESLEIITPIRGRKLKALKALARDITRLEIITPIRGRKQTVGQLHNITRTFRNNNPDKGTETKMLNH